MHAEDISQAIVDIGIPEFIREKTKGRPHVFVLMPFGARKHFYLRMKEKVEREVGLACLRADDVPAAGHDLLGKIHLLIERAELVIADITDANPNVFYEVGYSRALRKPMVLLVEAGQDLPTDVRGLEVIRHEVGDDDTALNELVEQLKLRLTSRMALLRDMLQADKPTPAYVIAAPKHRPSSVGDAMRHTFGDNLGILGLISAFGSLLGENPGVELLSAEHFALSFLDEPANVYLIGSKQVNQATGVILNKLQRGRGPNWYIGSKDPSDEVGHYEEALWRTYAGQRVPLIPEKREVAGMKICVKDHGIVVRGPHPSDPNHLALVLAGPTTLGTGAACLAATRSVLLSSIQAKLGNVRIGDKSKSIWALVEGNLEVTSGVLQVDGVKILDAGAYE